MMIMIFIKTIVIIERKEGILENIIFARKKKWHVNWVNQLLVKRGVLIFLIQDTIVIKLLVIL